VIESDPATDRMVIANSIVWGNANAPDLTGWSGAGAQTSEATINNAIIGTGNYTPGAGVSSADPRFVDAAHGNDRLMWTSPAIDAGSNAAVPVFASTDLAGDPRIINGTVDLGAYEFGATVTTTAVGGSGGSPFGNIMCPGNSIATALKGRAGDDIDALDLWCGSPSSYAGSVPTSSGGGAPFNLSCPAGFALVGIYGTAGVVNFGSALVDTLGGICTNPVTNVTVQTGTAGQVAYVYGTPPPFTVNCPAGTAVAGLYGRGGFLLDQLGLVCK